MYTESLMNIEILKFTDMDISEESFQYNNVQFKLDTLSQYNGLSIEINSNWDITVWDVDKTTAQFNIIEVEEFQLLLLNKINNK